jgi:hypothetical protein
VKATVACGASVCGLRVLMLNPVPLALALVIFRLAVPVFLSVTFTVDVFPTAMLPKLMLDGFADNAACVPVPLTEITSGLLVALELTVMLPDTVPAAVGAKLAVTVALPPAAICCPAITPVAPKPAEAVTLLIVIVVAPEFVKTIGCVLVCPTTTLLKLKLPGFAFSVFPAATALPVIVNVCVAPGALSVNRMLPDAPLVELGVNVTPNVVEPLAAIVFGAEKFVSPKPAPETIALVTTKLVFPVFESVTFCVLVCPTVTLLKFSEVGENEGTASKPVPLNEIPSDEFDALLVTVNAPDAGVIEVGANCTWTVALWPAAKLFDGVPPTCPPFLYRCWSH